MRGSGTGSTGATSIRTVAALVASQDGEGRSGSPPSVLYVALRAEQRTATMGTAERVRSIRLRKEAVGWGSACSQS